ncbi:hypothetical protein AAU57_03180 [Nonlabens sp. YIK11]|uniref:outer membrane beta-barrel protein n=1 Tax=Nonlabens sp. YIK11 TaxID=1453349 RepID=UPI0007083C81|nr:outer membrane beta-barrel protein [Nonlabens sp. YIK11]KQC32443.1 hypothetical protein AAU57_03180 [Nonlabens sp. YIK11]
MSNTSTRSSRLPLFTTCILFLFFILGTQAQPKEGRFIEGSIGFGLTSPYEEAIDVLGNGFFVQGEYVIAMKSWFGIRPYVGFVTTKTDPESSDDAALGFKANTTALLLGGKIRLAAPIPYVAPYFEVGYGMSIGKFETLTRTYDIDKSGVVGHIPVTLGLALGKNHEVEVEFTYFFQNSVEQFTGAAAIGLSFPIGNPSNQN